jgi:hypothetical protein
MSGEFDAAGNLANAGLAAGVIEGREARKPGEGRCLNCDAPLGGRYCSNCGQAAEPTRSLWHLIEEAAWGVFNFDTKVWRTLPQLLFRPGTLTRRYIYGKRARYVSPLALFLLCIFFMFFVFSLLPSPNETNLGQSAAEAANERVSDARENLQDARAGLQEARQGLAELRSDLRGVAPNAARRASLAALEQAASLAQAEVERRQTQLTQAEQRQAELARGREPQERAAVAVEQAGAHVSDGETLDDLLRKISRDNLTLNGRPALDEHMRAQLANPQLFYYKLQEAASKFSFLLAPISLPFIAFLFLFKRGVTLYDHVVFALNSLSFAALLFVVIMLAAQVAWLRWIPGTALLFGLPAHTFFHVGGAYALKWWSALWRTFFLLFFALISLFVFFCAVLFIGLAG